MVVRQTTRPYLVKERTLECSLGTYTHLHPITCGSPDSPELPDRPQRRHGSTFPKTMLGEQSDGIKVLTLAWVATANL
jgi:hypothetical protein